MQHKKIYERYHSSRLLQKRIITKNNFTYRGLIPLLDKYCYAEKKVLDIGCGVGTLDFYLASRGNKVVGVDISTRAINIARKNAYFLGVSKNIRFHKLAFPQELPRGKFDVVIISEVIEHIPDDILSLERIWRLLKTGGILILTTPSIQAPLYKLGLLNGFDRKVGHLRRYDIDELTNNIRLKRFKIICVTRVEGILRNFLFTNDEVGKLIRFIRGPLSSLFTFIDKLTIPVFGYSNIQIVAKKR